MVTKTDLIKISVKERSTANETHTRRAMNKKELSREIGLEFGALFGKHFLKLEHLNYGYWTDDLPVDITNLHIAQNDYAKHLISKIPHGVQSILDVGCGLGGLAKMLLDAGYRVDCVVPSPFLAEKAGELLGDQCSIYECCYEKLHTNKRYDLVMFSESFQYMNPKDALGKTISLLNDGGYLLISDIFKKDDVPGKSPVSGGYLWSVFQAALEPLAFELVSDEDITAHAAPTIDIEARLFREVGIPMLALGEDLGRSRSPTLLAFVKWLMRKKLKKLETKYIGGRRTGESFQKYKTYRTLLYKLED